MEMAQHSCHRAHLVFTSVVCDRLVAAGNLADTKADSQEWLSDWNINCNIGGCVS
jgi:hypothetical protein